MVIHGWGGSTLSNGQVEVGNDMARKWYICFLNFQYFCVYIEIDIDCGKFSSFVNANISSYANTYEDVGIDVTVSNPNEKGHYCIFKPQYHAMTLSYYLYYDAIIVAKSACRGIHFFQYQPAF